MTRHSPAPLRLSLIAITAAALTVACGKPAAPGGGDDEFAQAGMQGGGEPLVSGRSLELVSWLVQFNRLNSPEKLETMLNKTPGKFVPVDANKDGKHDYIAVSEDPEPARDDHALLLRAHPDADAPDEEEGVLLATLFFNEDWALTGYSRSVAKAPPPTPTTIAVAAASAATYSASQKAEPVQAAAIATAIGQAPDSAPSDPVLDAAPSKAAPAVVAAPTGSDADAGLRAVP